MTVEPRQRAVEPAQEPRKRAHAYSQWQGDYVVLCERSFETAAGRVAQAKEHGVCPACAEKTPQKEIDVLKERALARDRARYRATHQA